MSRDFCKKKIAETTQTRLDGCMCTVYLIYSGMVRNQVFIFLNPNSAPGSRKGQLFVWLNREQKTFSYRTSQSFYYKI